MTRMFRVARLSARGVPTLHQPSLQVSALEQQRKAYADLAASNADIVARVTALQASSVGFLWPCQHLT